MGAALPGSHDTGKCFSPLSSTTHLTLLLCSAFVSVQPPGTGCGNWPGLLAHGRFCGAGVKQMYACPLASCCVYAKGPKLAFCSCHPPATFRRPCKIPCVTLSVLMVWVFRYGSLCCFNLPAFEQVTWFGYETCCHFSCSAESLFLYLCVPRANANFSVHSLF